MSECVYLGRQAGCSIASGQEPQPLYLCRHPAHKMTTLAACAKCGDRVESAGMELPPGKRPESSPPAFYQPTGRGRHDFRQIDLRGLYAGANVFLCLGGPSMLSTPTYQLLRRGVLVASTNNNAAALPPPVRPHIWIHTDSPKKFHDSLWRDPAVMKFTPTQEWRRSRKRNNPDNPYLNIRRRVAGNDFEPLGPLACEMPNTIGFERASNFNPETYLVEPEINRGNCKRSAHRNHYPHVINTMFACIKILYVLGFARIYLVGADFRMDPQQPYAFGQQKSPGGVNANNSAFAKMNSMFALLQPRLLAAGCEVYNATPRSGLTAFPACDFAEAVESVAGTFENQLNGVGWYDNES